MKLNLTVRANASSNRVEKIDESNYRVWTTETPEKGKANQAVIKLLADFLDLPQSRLTIKRGHTGNRKTIEVQNP